jgi:hypothetical protein
LGRPTAEVPELRIFVALIFVALDLVRLPKIFSQVVEQATDGPRKGLNPPPARR